ncbi:uncharacterized protein FIBRA_04106 [Fibroporia radiculosa]|uniref:Uncharacterized protein n=1 Tax=Fibroporia radiculosa TaxID=599839 RepID=J4GNX4_9APHY|nr:uncharacterized protein FIBRA_04106 [Fibroporia radiculosa]CCM02030.1 predicted protein [Fibroporia radiculosa]
MADTPTFSRTAVFQIDSQRRKLTPERAKANYVRKKSLPLGGSSSELRTAADCLSGQLRLRLQYARLKVEHGWQRQNLNEVENLYFRHAHMHRPPPMISAGGRRTTGGSSATLASSSHFPGNLPRPGSSTHQRRTAQNPGHSRAESHFQTTAIPVTSLPEINPEMPPNDTNFASFSSRDGLSHSFAPPHDGQSEEPRERSVSRKRPTSRTQESAPSVTPIHPSSTSAQDGTSPPDLPPVQANTSALDILEFLTAPPEFVPVVQSVQYLQPSVGNAQSLQTSDYHPVFASHPAHTPDPASDPAPFPPPAAPPPAHTPSAAYPPSSTPTPSTSTAGLTYDAFWSSHSLSTQSYRNVLLNSTLFQHTTPHPTPDSALFSMPNPGTPGSHPTGLESSLQSYAALMANSGQRLPEGT